MAGVPLDKFSKALGESFAEGDTAHVWRMQETANVELLGRMVHVIAERRFQDLRPHFTDDVSYEIAVPASLPFVRQAAGVDDVVSAIMYNFSVLSEQRTQPLAVVSQGDTVMVMARENGRMADTGVPYQALLAQQFTFRDGKLAVFRSVTQIE